MAIDVARMITKYVNSIRLGGETADGETAANDTALLQPLTGYINVLVGPVAYAIRVDHTEILWRLVDKACKKIGVNIRVEVQVHGAQDPGPYDVLVTMQVESQNNPNQINHWGLTSTGKVRVEFHDDAGADEELKLSFTGDRIPKEQKQLRRRRERKGECERSFEGTWSMASSQKTCCSGDATVISTASKSSCLTGSASTPVRTTNAVCRFTG